MTSSSNNIRFAYLAFLVLASVLGRVASLAPGLFTRRHWVRNVAGAYAGVAIASIVVPDNHQVAWAATDCYQDCVKNCKSIAPKNEEYCVMNCRDYCNQDDRKDGLSGSVSFEGGEVGILGGSFGSGTVVKGEDKPPSVAIPGLDFTSEKGRKLIGY